MAVKTSWAAGDVLLAADLTDTFAAKAALAGATYSGTHDFTGATLAGVTSGLNLITAVSLSGSAVNINNCFTSTYDAYRIIVRSTHSTAGQLRFRMRASGSDETGSVYIWQGLWGEGSTGTAQTATETNGYLYGGSVATNFLSSSDFFGPQNTENTYATSVFRHSNPGVGIMGTIVNTTTAYDGITIYPSAGTFSGGVARVYGYKD